MSQKDGDQMTMMEAWQKQVLGGGAQFSQWPGQWRRWPLLFLLKFLSKP